MWSRVPTSDPVPLPVCVRHLERDSVLVEMMWAFESVVIYMEVNMNKLRMIFSRKHIVWLVVIIVLAAATTYAMLPQISLNSPTSFPVDI